VASTGELIIADNYDHRIRLVNNSIITTIAGSSVSIDYGNGGFTGDTGPATAALINEPHGITLVDSRGSEYFFSELGSSRIRVVRNNIIDTLLYDAVALDGVFGITYSSGSVYAVLWTNPGKVRLWGREVVSWGGAERRLGWGGTLYAAAVSSWLTLRLLMSCIGCLIGLPGPQGECKHRHLHRGGWSKHWD
jgi:hypothetical protein